MAVDDARRVEDVRSDVVKVHVAGSCLEQDIGSLIVGKRADVIAVDLGSPEAEPCYDPVSHLVHVAGREAVTDVWVDGRRVVAERRLATVDEADVVARARSWQERLQ